MYNSSKIKIGSIFLGGDSKVRIQSMTTTKTIDTYGTVSQIEALAKAGCDFVRITTQNIQEANNLKNIKEELLRLGINIPLIADVHFNPKVAEIAATIVDKVRINPGNYINSKESIEKHLIPLLAICKKEGTAIRIGVNHGSMSEHILTKYGNTSAGMVESLLEFVRICSSNSFHKLVLSVKASNVLTMIEANSLLVKKLIEEGLSYPIHIGVTEAGSDDEGRVKSAAGIGYLLAHGIGDTIRVSLTENPLFEIPVAKQLVETYGNRTVTSKMTPSNLIQIPTKYFPRKPPFVVTSDHSEFSDYSMINNDLLEKHRNNVKSYNIGKLTYSGLSIDNLIIRATTDATISLLNNKADGIWIVNKDWTVDDQNAKLLLQIFQVLGKRCSSTEFIACPTCGRTSLNLLNLLADVKKRISHIPELKIAVMGCSVNGPGEMADADYGILGAGNGKVIIYKTKNIITSVSVEQATDSLISIIKDNGDWIDCLY